MVTAFVLSGGGSLGAVQVGMLAALAEAGIQPDVLVGTSAGAVNAAWVAGHGAGVEVVCELAEAWAHIRRRDVFPLNLRHHVGACVGRQCSLCPNTALAGLLRQHLNIRHFEQAVIPVHLVATDVHSGQEVMLSSGELLPAVLASAAIPAVLPPVVVGERSLVDGGLADNAAISQAVALGADRVYVLPTGYACALPEAPRHPIGAALHALTLLIEQRLILEATTLAECTDLRIVPPLCPLSVSSANFNHAPELIGRAHRATCGWLDAGDFRVPHPERFLSLHSHRVGEAGSCMHTAVP